MISIKNSHSQVSIIILVHVTLSLLHAANFSQPNLKERFTMYQELSSKFSVLINFLISAKCISFYPAALSCICVVAKATYGNWGS